MAQELREGDGKSGIARAGKRKWGYDPAQVDAFLERAHALYDSCLLYTSDAADE